jgi:hypothetical protein
MARPQDDNVRLNIALHQKQSGPDFSGPLVNLKSIDSVLR